jgi:hypothetical protein
MLNPRWIVGKTVARVDLNSFDDGRAGTAHGPVIHFTDGSSISFSTEGASIKHEKRLEKHEEDDPRNGPFSEWMT